MPVYNCGIRAYISFLVVTFKARGGRDEAEGLEPPLVCGERKS